MTIKTLNDWKKAWDDASGKDAKKAQTLLQQYVDDSKVGVAGFTYPINWYVTSGGKNVRYLSAEPVEKALKHVAFDDDVALLLRHVKQALIYFYSTRFYGIRGIFKKDELVHVLNAIKEKTGVDYFTLDLSEDELMSHNISHG